MESWLERLPHWFVPAWVGREVLGALAGVNVWLYVCASTTDARESDAKGVERNMTGVRMKVV